MSSAGDGKLVSGFPLNVSVADGLRPGGRWGSGWATSGWGGGSLPRRASGRTRGTPSPSSFRDREGHVQGLRPPLQQHGHAVARLDALGGALEVLHAADSLSVDLANDVATLHPRFGRRALFLDPRYDHTVRRAKAELSLDVRRDRPRLETEEALALAARLQLGGFLRRLAELDLERLFALVAPDLDRHAFARRRCGHDFLQILRSVDPFAVELDEHVTRGQSRPVGGAVLDDVGDEHAPGLFEGE